MVGSVLLGMLVSGCNFDQRLSGFAGFVDDCDVPVMTEWQPAVWVWDLRTLCCKNFVGSIEVVVGSNIWAQSVLAAFGAVVVANVVAGSVVFVHRRATGVYGVKLYCSRTLANTVFSLISAAALIFSRLNSCGGY